MILGWTMGPDHLSMDYSNLAGDRVNAVKSIDQLVEPSKLSVRNITLPKTIKKTVRVSQIEFRNSEKFPEQGCLWEFAQNSLCLIKRSHTKVINFGVQTIKTVFLIVLSTIPLRSPLRVWLFEAQSRFYSLTGECRFSFSMLELDSDLYFQCPGRLEL